MNPLTTVMFSMSEPLRVTSKPGSSRNVLVGAGRAKIYDVSCLHLTLLCNYLRLIDLSQWLWLVTQNPSNDTSQVFDLVIDFEARFKHFSSAPANTSLIFAHLKFRGQL